MSTPFVVALLTSDIHLCQRPPTFRSDEPDWYEAMLRPIEQIKKLRNKHKGIPIICAGDIFDKWQSPPELINFAIKHLPTMYAIPGQHDLPNHEYENIQRSAYWTLVESGVIHNMLPNAVIKIPSTHDFTIHATAFPWGSPLKPNKKEPALNSVSLAVVHHYCWKAHRMYNNADTSSNVVPLAKSLKGFDAAVFGDNHLGFYVSGKTGLPNVLNCGGLMRRKSDEVNERPAVGLLLSDGTVTRQFLDCSTDVFLTAEMLGLAGTVEELDDSFVQDLLDLGSDALDFVEAIRHYVRVHKVPKSVRTVIQKILNKEE